MKNMGERISRRSFFALLLAGFFAFVLYGFRRLDPSLEVQKFFGLEEDIREKARSRFAALKRRNPKLYQQSSLFFALSHYRAERLLPVSVRERVLNDWVYFLFSNRDLAWGYIGYPRVGDYQVCNGLIRG